MSLFKNPAEHAANPPESWEPVKLAERLWGLQLLDGLHLSDHFTTKKAAEAAKVSGFAVDLYRKEAVWYAGGEVAGWKPYAEVAAEAERLAARWKDLADA